LPQGFISTPAANGEGDIMSNKDDLSDYLPTKLGLPELVQQANTGDKAALAALRQTLDENPQIWRTVGDLALHARMVMVDAIANGDQLVRDSLLRHAHEMETDLAGPSPNRLESLAVQRIVACWLETQYAALQGPEPTGNTLKHAKFALQIRESAEKRFNAAIKSLSLIRKMLPSGAAEAIARRDTAAATAPAPSPNGGTKQVAEPRPESADRKPASAPANRLSGLLNPSAQRTNGQVNRLRVFAEDAVPEEKREPQLV
jgi:hypothetical protein